MLEEPKEQFKMKIFALQSLGKIKPFAKPESLKATYPKSKSSDNSSNDEDNICTRVGAKNSIKYFLQNTTLHGLKYIAEDKITNAERIFFGLSFLLVIGISAFFISNVYVKWSASPIIISASAQLQLTSTLPFPAITICNLNQALKSRVSSIRRGSSNFTLLMSLCDQGGEIPLTYVGTWRYFKALLIDVAQPCQDMLLYCSFGAKVENCSWMFNSVLTDDGLCCTFNALDPIFLLRNYSDEVRFSTYFESHYTPIDWTPEKGYAKVLPEYFFPRVSGGTGSRMGLTVVLNASTSEYYCTKSKSMGFKVLVHSPAELPKISNYGFLVTAGREVRIPIEPVYQDAQPSIRSIKKKVRRCLFSDEGDLVHYRTYSRKNCELECEARILLEKCHCVLYYLPRIDPQSRICGPNDNQCTNQIQTEIESSNDSVTCDKCWPGCFELNYKASVTTSRIAYGDFITVNDLPDELFNTREKIQNLSILYFYYFANTFRSTTKSEMFGLTEFLSNTGGLLGLFMGFSIFSLIEIIYYVTVRPYCANRTMEKQKRKRIEQLKWLTPIKHKTKQQKLFQYNESHKMNKILRNSINDNTYGLQGQQQQFTQENRQSSEHNQYQHQHQHKQQHNIYPYVD